LNEIKANLTLYLTPNQTLAMQGGHNAAGQSNPTGTIISGQGDPQGILLPNPGVMIAAVLISMSISSIILLLLAFLYFHLARFCGWHPILFRRNLESSSIAVHEEDNTLLKKNRSGMFTQ